MNDKKQLLAKCEEVIKEHDLYFVEYLVAYLPCSKATFYAHFPFGSDELNHIKGLLSENKTKKKVKLLKNWEKEEAPAALQISLMKLIGTDDERKRLSTNHNVNDNTTNVKIIKVKSSDDDEEVDHALGDEGNKGTQDEEEE